MLIDGFNKIGDYEFDYQYYHNCCTQEEQEACRQLYVSYVNEKYTLTILGAYTKIIYVFLFIPIYPR